MTKSLNHLSIETSQMKLRRSGVIVPEISEKFNKTQLQIATLASTERAALFDAHTGIFKRSTMSIPIKPER